MEGAPNVDASLTCIDCGGRCFPLVHWAPDDPPIPGDVVAYRCEDCNDRWDIVVPDPDDGVGDGPAPGSAW